MRISNHWSVFLPLDGWNRGEGVVTQGVSVQQLLSGSSAFPPLAGIPEFAIWAQTFGSSDLMFNASFSRNLLNGVCCTWNDVGCSLPLDSLTLALHLHGQARAACLIRPMWPHFCISLQHRTLVLWNSSSTSTSAKQPRYGIGHKKGEIESEEV